MAPRRRWRTPNISASATVRCCSSTRTASPATAAGSRSCRCSSRRRNRPRRRPSREIRMDVGMMMVFASYGWENCPDDRVWSEEIRLAGLAADLGFDCLWSAEHHFNDYSFVPDNLHLMTYLAAHHPDIDVGTAAVILPWHDPVRVAEDAAVLDMCSKRRLRLGIGRRLARREFAPSPLSLAESRRRFPNPPPTI